MFKMSAIAKAAFRCTEKCNDNEGDSNSCYSIRREAVGTVISRLSNPSCYSIEASGNENARTLVSIWYSTFWTLLDLLDPAEDDVPNSWHITEFYLPNFTSRTAQLATEHQKNIEACLLRMGVIEATIQKFHSVDWSARKSTLSFWGPDSRYPISGFLGRLKSYGDLISDMQLRVPVESRRAIQLKRARDLEPIFVNPNAALAILSLWFRPEPLFLSAQTAWKLLLQSLEWCGIEYIRHDREYSILNERRRDIEEMMRNPVEPNPERDQVLTLMAMETARHEEAIALPLWLLKERLAPRALLQHSGAPTGLIESPQWQLECDRYQTRMSRNS